MYLCECFSVSDYQSFFLVAFVLCCSLVYLFCCINLCLSVSVCVRVCLQVCVYPFKYLFFCVRVRNTNIYIHIYNKEKRGKRREKRIGLKKKVEI